MLQYALAMSVSVLICGAVSAQEMGSPISAGAMKWAPAPPFIPKGMQVTVLAGNPEKEGPFTLRLKSPADYVFPPHSIPFDETVTLLSGALFVGIGDKFDRSKTQLMQEGSFVQLPGKINHYSVNQTETIVEVHSMGPAPITYANPADDPSKKQ